MRPSNFKQLVLILIFAFFLGVPIPQLWAAGEILIEPPNVKQLGPTRFRLTTAVTNQTDEPREVTLRAQISLYDQTVPKGDVPVSLFRKDKTFILRAKETRQLDELFVGEGLPAKGALRFEPYVRVRRQRVWNY